LSLERYRENPFTAGMVIPIKGKQVQLSAMGKDENILINQSTGEVQGTHVTTYKKVDSEQFIKIFPAQIGAIFELKAAGIKALGLLMWLLKDAKSIDKDKVLVDSYSLEDFLKSSEGQTVKLSAATMKRGLNELEKASIIAKTIRKGFYFINPNFIFNGNRVAFTTIIDRKEEGTEAQIDMDLK
jgi:hypothetical protein